jgi:hypothetical protein
MATIQGPTISTTPPTPDPARKARPRIAPLAILFTLMATICWAVGESVLAFFLTLLAITSVFQWINACHEEHARHGRVPRWLRILEVTRAYLANEEPDPAPTPDPQ